MPFMLELRKLAGLALTTSRSCHLHIKTISRVQQATLSCSGSTSTTHLPALITPLIPLPIASSRIVSSSVPPKFTVTSPQWWRRSPARETSPAVLVAEASATAPPADNDPADIDAAAPVALLALEFFEARLGDHLSSTNHEFRRRRGLWLLNAEKGNVQDEHGSADAPIKASVRVKAEQSAKSSPGRPCSLCHQLTNRMYVVLR